MGLCTLRVLFSYTEPQFSQVFYFLTLPQAQIPKSCLPSYSVDTNLISADNEL